MATYRDSSTARKQGAEKNAFDAWMRFVNHGIFQALIFANAIRNSQDRMALSPLAEPTRLTTARRLLEPHITQKLLPAIERFIAGLLPAEKRARLIDFALRKYRVGDTATAWA